MTTIHTRVALLNGKFTSDVRVTLANGRIASVDIGAAAQSGDDRVGLLLPGMASLHSHAFQRGMAGLAEVRGSSEDSFWTWRETMYRFALAMSPDQLEAIAAQLYVEMLEAGFTRVGEFHYLHHDLDGRPYGDIAEMATRICAAAEETGLHLTLLPAFYAHATFGGATPTPGQRRFVNDLDSYARLLDGCRRQCARLENASLGVAPHSLRAVTPSELAAVVAMAPEGPVHIHAAEQTREVEDCRAWSGKPPVEWLLDNAYIGRRWCLIHATHMTEAETKRLAVSGATAGLCPVTEANLGDGIFDGPRFLRAGGSFGIGTDSNILIGITDELRQLEYSQRLRNRARNVLSIDSVSTGQTLYQRALDGGAKALGVPMPALAVGAAADLISIDIDQPQFAAVPSAQLLDAWIFTSRGGVDTVWVAGRKLVERGRHTKRATVHRRFLRAMMDLTAT